MSAALLESYRGVVYPWHCDHMGHMNVAWYVGKFDEATWSLFTAIGLGRSALLPKARGMAAVRQAIAYHREVSVGQSLIALSGVLHLGRTSLRFFHRMIQQEDSAVVAETVLTAVHLDLTTRRPTPFADEVRAGAEAWIRLAPDGFALPTGE